MVRWVFVLLSLTDQQSETHPSTHMLEGEKNFSSCVLSHICTLGSTALYLHTQTHTCSHTSTRGGGDRKIQKQRQTERITKKVVKCTKSENVQ